MSSYRSVVSSPLGILSEPEQDQPPRLPSSLRSGDERFAAAPSSEGGEVEDTFTQMLSILVDQPVGSMSISPTSRDVALGTRKGLYIVDLANPYEQPRFLSHSSSWEVADVQWAVFPHRSQYVASTSNQKAVVYNLDLATPSPSSNGASTTTNGYHHGSSGATDPIEHSLHAHTRAVTDINWSTHHPDVLATCGLDGWIWSWDLRAGYGGRRGAGRKPAWGVSSFGTAATQVKWNRREAHVIASAHDNKVFVWDDRMGAEPVTTIQGHTAKIYGIDWSRQETDKLLTCSLDKSFKSWNVKNPTTSLLSVHTSAPVWRARFLPFGSGALTLPQRSDHSLSIWSREAVEKSAVATPVATVEGCRQGIKEFVWRSRGGTDLSSDDRTFQLVTFSGDRRLRLWPISEALMAEVGHVKGSPITIPLPRLQKVPERTYTKFYNPQAVDQDPIAFPASPPPPIPRHLGPGPATQSLLSASLASSAPSLLTSSLLSASFASKDQQQPQPVSPSGRVQNEGPLQRPGAKVKVIPVPVSNVGRAGGNSDRLAWMEGVRYSNADDGAADEADGGPGQPRVSVPGQASVAASTAGDVTLTRASSLTRGATTDPGTAREAGAQGRAGESTAGGETIDRPGSVQTGTATGVEKKFANLGEEMTTIMRRLPRINFEKTNVAGRTCTVSLYNGPLFLRASFTFPRGYPLSAAPAIELERTADVPLKARAFLLQSTRKLMARRKAQASPSLEQALRFLSGDQSGLEDEPKLAMDDDDDDDDEEDGAAQANLTSSFIIGDGGMEIIPGLGSQRAYNIPPPRRAGAVFSPTGKLIVFSDVVASVTFAAAEREREREESLREYEERARKESAGGGPRGAFVRVSDAFGVIGGGDWDAGSYVETDEALQLSTGLSFRSRLPSKPLVIAPPPPSGPTFSSVLTIHDVSHLTLGHPSRGVKLGLRSDPGAIAKEAALAALDRRDAFLAKVWATLAVVFQNVASEIEGGASEPPLTSCVVEGAMIELLELLVQMRDVQTLGVLACLVQMAARPYLNQMPQHRNSPLQRRRSLIPGRSPGVDYFNQTHSNHHIVHNSSSNLFAHALATPTIHHSGTSSRRTSGGLSATHSAGGGHSPRPSWPSFSGFFNSHLSLRSGASSPELSGTVTPMPDRDRPHGESSFFLGSNVSTPGATRSANSSAAHLPALLTSSPKNQSPKSAHVGLPRPSPDLSLHPRPGLARVGSSPGVPSSLGGSARSTRHHSRASPGGTGSISHGVTFGGSTVVEPKSSPSAAISATWAEGRADGTPPLSALSIPVSVERKKFVRVQLVDQRPVLPWWLRAQTLVNLELLRVAYAELLARRAGAGESEWNEERVLVLKLCGSLSKPVEAGGELYGPARIRAGNGYDRWVGLEVVPASQETEDDGALERAHRRQCALCHLPIDGLASACTLCNHLLHPACSERWFASDTNECPAGCGCHCVTSGGTCALFGVAKVVADAVTPSQATLRQSAAVRRELLESLSPKSAEVSLRGEEGRTRGWGWMQ